MSAEASPTSSPTGDDVRLLGANRSARLVVFVHGFGAKPEEYDGLLGVVQESASADVYVPRYAASDLLSPADPHDVAADLARRFNKAAANYPRIHFVAHSMGAAFLRDAFLKGLGRSEQPTPLRERLERGDLRMTLLAGTSRGYTPSGVRQSLRLELLRRWFWLSLLVVAVAWSTRAALPQREWESSLDVAGPIVGGAVLVGATAAALSHRLSTPNLRTGVGYLIIAAASWLMWVFSGRAPAAGFAIAFQIVGTFEVGRLLNGERPAWGMAGTAAAVGALAPWIATHPAWAWPATLATLLPLALYPLRSRLLLEHVLYGAPWITGVRLRWINTFSRPGGLSPPPMTHLFGDEDRMVGDEDHVEFHHATDALELAIRGVAHGDFQLSRRLLDRERAPTERKSRQDVFTPSLLDAVRLAVGKRPHDRLRELVAEAGPRTKRPSPHGAYRLVEPIRHGPRASAKSPDAGDAGVKHAVFLVHGIRDHAGWQESLAAKVREVAADRDLSLIEPIQVRYGYFSALQFLLVGERERATRSFLDLYTQTKARHPEAVCHVAAHSNGTYVVANGLLRHPYVELKNLYLAGSVLSRDFPWSGVGPRTRSANDRHGLIAGRIRSDRAAQDWPVGVLGGLLAGLGRLPPLRTCYGLLGTGGVRGFRERNDAGGTPFVFENAYLPGPHGEALNGKYHAEIAEFVLTGEPTATSRLLARTPDERLLRRMLLTTAAGLTVVATAFVLPAALGPACAAWGILVGALTLLLVVRLMMEV
jgi:hypothetical protein